MKGCVGGYSGQYCDVPCVSNFYGENCVSQCSDGCAVTPPLRSCNAADGTCLQGCKPGYMPPLCDSKCRPGWFGQDCKHQCDCVRDTPCDSAQGCTVACAGMRKPPTCRCLLNYWGDNCDQECGVCAGRVDCFLNGSCSGGCAPGYKPPYCLEPCDVGMYGPDCASQCGQCFYIERCRRTDGMCRGGCKFGYYGPQCQQSCADINHQHKDCRRRTILDFGATGSDVAFVAAIACTVFGCILGLAMLAETLLS